MESKTKRFILCKFKFLTTAGETIERYMITDNRIPLIEPNQWIEMKSMRKAGTGREYAAKLVVYLNFLDGIGIDYKKADNSCVLAFINCLLYGDLNDLVFKPLDARLSYSTLKKYITVITGFYSWLDQTRNTNMMFYKRSNHVRARKSFLYGQIYTYDYQYIIDVNLPHLKGQREYTKWYDQPTIDLLCSNFITLRDAAVFRLTLEGFRIDEVLSMTLGSIINHIRKIQNRHIGMG